MSLPLHQLVIDDAEHAVMKKSISDCVAELRRRARLQAAERTKQETACLNDTLAACFGKQIFASKYFASKIAKQSNRRTDNTLIPYKCPACGQFHIGHSQSR
jgi:hypothetical protein